MTASCPQGYPGKVELAPETVKPSITRLRRAHGQLAAVIRMLEEGRDCEVEEDGDVDLAKMEKLFLSLA